MTEHKMSSGMSADWVIPVPRSPRCPVAPSPVPLGLVCYVIYTM